MDARHQVGRSALVAALATAVSGMLGCAAPVKAPTVPPASAAPAAAPVASTLRQTDPPAGLGSVERYAWLTVIQFGEAFAAGDVDGFLSRVSRGFYRGYPALEQGLRALFAASTSRSAIVAVSGVTVEGDRVGVRARWERTLTRGDGAPEMLAGETEFVFFKSESSLRLLDFRGDAPFGIEGIPAVP
jgi:hypothetical protein